MYWANGTLSQHHEVKTPVVSRWSSFFSKGHFDGLRHEHRQFHGGKNKTSEQIKGIKNSFIAVDDIEYGNPKKIPLWLFGFCIACYFS